MDVPFDLVLFPSLGMFYPDKRQGVMVRCLTGIEENILTAPMLSSTHTALDLVLKSVIIDEDVDADKLLVGDKNAIILFLRATSFGVDYPVVITCPLCNASGKSSFNITQLQSKDLYEFPDEQGEFTCVLPKMKFNNKPVVVKFRPMTYADEKIIDDGLAMDKMNPRTIPRHVTMRYVNQITSIQGNTNKDIIQKLIKKMPINDSRYLHEYMDKVEPGIDNKISLKCNSCNKTFNEKFEVDSKFIALPPEYKDVMWNESFLWYYYGKGVTLDETQYAATALRRWSIQRINQEIDKKNEAEKKAHEQAQNRRSK